MKLPASICRLPLPAIYRPMPGLEPPPPPTHVVVLPDGDAEGARGEPPERKPRSRGGGGKVGATASVASSITAVNFFGFAAGDATISLKS